ncbi:MAG: roadblock/LC7 domain-containing protein [Nitrospiria bacterium]
MAFGKRDVEDVKDVSPSRIDTLNEVLADLKSASGEIDACAVVSGDGLTMASLLPPQIDEPTVSSMSAIMISMGERTSVALARGPVEQLFVMGEKGYVISQYAGKNALLMVLAPKNAKLGVLFFYLSKAAERVKEILS